MSSDMGSVPNPVIIACRTIRHADLRFDRADLLIISFMCLDDHVVNYSWALGRAEELHRTRTLFHGTYVGYTLYTKFYLQYAINVNFRDTVSSSSSSGGLVPPIMCETEASWPTAIIFY